ncbi:ABC-type glycerol-3-phosphate transport system substrate-binding protein [Paenibacillus castaneae]|uniref:ABC transporter substrate-binding protein n=1 Tax=Paenibacillus castaneae TaxID=474957 RepID=UPI000C9BF692|nr:extracellular solute-binding protein [Paenibacillus castaneae]NIK77800.1 ABC-type glycerol-3-phosphate transport system substrate-binding protein [Paenibacillus castaneae]
MRNRKRNTFLIVILIMLILLSACQKQSIGIEDKKLSGTIRIALSSGTKGGGWPAHTLGESDNGPIYDKIRAFVKDHPNVNVEIIGIDFVTNQPSTIPQDPFPDIIELAPNQIRWIAQGELENLDGLAQVSNWTEAYTKLVEKTQVDGSTWALPVRSDPMIVYYDSSVFQQLNLVAPSDGWTWNDFLSVSMSLANSGYSTDIPDQFDAVEHIIGGLGGSYVSKDGKQFHGYLDSEATIKAFEQYVASIRTQYVNKKAKSAQTALGMSRASDLYPLFKQGDVIKLAPMPVFPDGQKYNTMLTTGLALSSASKNKEAATELLKAIVGGNEEDAVRFANYNALVINDPRYYTKAPAQFEELLWYMGLETAVAIPSTFQMNSDTRNHYGVLNLHSQQFAEAYPNVFIEGKEKQTLEQLAAFIDSLFPTLKGKW